MKCGHDFALVAAGGLANDVYAGNDAQQSDQALVAGDGVGQDMLLVLEVELELGLGNVQAGMDDGVCFSHGVCRVRAHSCTYERAVVAAAPSTVRVTDTRRERLRLPNERVLTVPEGNERARAGATPPAGGVAPPSSCSAFSRTRKMKKDIQEGKGEGEQDAANQNGRKNFASSTRPAPRLRVELSGSIRRAEPLESALPPAKTS